MIRLSALTLAAGLAVCGASLAHAGGAMTGKWTYKVGVTGTPCTLIFGRSGDVTADGSCNAGLATVGHWQMMGTSLDLTSPSGSLVGILHAKGDDYVGKQIGGGRMITLSR